MAYGEDIFEGHDNEDEYNTNSEDEGAQQFFLPNEDEESIEENEDEEIWQIEDYWEDETHYSESMNKELKDNVDKLLKSNRFGFYRNGRRIVMPHPKEIIDAIKKFGGEYIARIEANVGNITSNFGLNEKEYYSFNKYMIIATLANSEVDGHTVNVVAVVNNAKGWAKIFAGARAWACWNGMITGAETDIEKIELSEGVVNFEGPIERVIEIALNTKVKVASEIEKLKNTVYDEAGWYQRKGEIMSKLPKPYLTYITSAEILLRDKGGLYNKMGMTDWALFSALTHTISDKSNVEHEVDVTLLFQKLFDVFQTE